MKKQLIFLLIFAIVAFMVVGFLPEKQTASSVKDSADFSTIIIPVKIHTISENSGIYSSSRSEENIISLISETNRIWEQAGIYFQIEEIAVIETSPKAIPDTIKGNYLELYSHQNFSDDEINIFLTKNLEGINGLAFSSINSIFVADYTTVNDFRTTAHELGHILGLNHVEPINRLMARGKNGELFTIEEVLTTRNNV